MEEPNPPENRNINTGGGNYNERIEGDYIQGNVFQNIFNILGGQQTTPVGNPARPNNQRILLAAVKEEVTARLRQSLHNAVLINLGKESQPQQVKRPWDAEIKIGLKPAVPLPDTTTILQVFDSEEIAGKLLILGAPGSGKTTTQLELAQALVCRAEDQPEYPVPVLFNLSSWKDDRQSLTDWLVAELKSKYGVSTKLGQEWVDNHQLLPLLDGLDELEPQRQELCVNAINQFLVSENRPLSLVVCSRSEEYSNYSTQLQLNGAIYLQPLTNNQISDYLNSINSTELWSTISSDLDLLELVRTPLLLSITVLASQEISVEEWQHLASTADRLQYLLDAYVGRMLTRDINSRAYLKNKTPNARKTRMQLVWLAKQMLLESKTEFLIEEMQPILLKTKIAQVIYNCITWGVIQALILGLMGGLKEESIEMLILRLMGVLKEESIEVLILRLMGGLILGLMGGLINGLFGEIIEYTLEKMALIRNNKYFLKSIMKWLIIELILGLIIMGGNGLILGLYGGLIFGLVGDAIKTFETQKFSYKNFQKMFISLLSSGHLIWMIAWIFFVFSNLDIENKNIPNQGILESAINTLKLSVFYLVPSTILIFFIKLIFSIDNSLNEYLISSLKFGLFFGLLAGMLRGGTTVIKHFTLRLILYRNGYIPWNYARFLDYCTERLFLQRVGGRYRFIHKLLQDHFAQMEFKRN